MNQRLTRAMVLVGFDWGGLKENSLIVDVAGGIGQNLKVIIAKYQSIQGINIDLPEVKQHASSHPLIICKTSFG